MSGARSKLRRNARLALRRFGCFIRDLARELADENAYSRHLAWHHREHSREEWNAFYEARLKHKYRQGRCC